MGSPADTDEHGLIIQADGDDREVMTIPTLRCSEGGRRGTIRGSPEDTDERGLIQLAEREDYQGMIMMMIR